MNVGKVLLGMGTAVGLLSSTVAMAATTRSAAALPSVHGALVPVNALRTATPIKRKSAQADESATGTYIVGGLAAAAVIAGVVVIASDSDNDDSSSPG